MAVAFLAVMSQGVAAALGSTRLIANLLYKVSPRDPQAFGAAFVVMAIAALAACFLPRGAPRGPIRCGRCGINPSGTHLCKMPHAFPPSA